MHWAEKANRIVRFVILIMVCILLVQLSECGLYYCRLQIVSLVKSKRIVLVEVEKVIDQKTKIVCDESGEGVCL